VRIPGKSILVFVLPRRMRPHLLRRFFGAQIGPGCLIGRSLFLCGRMSLGAGAKIGSGNVIGPVRALTLQDGAEIGNLNWIASLAEEATSHFGQPRFPELVLKRESALTNRHYIDCQDQITIGEFSTVAGIRSTVWTHEIDIGAGRQKTQPVSIGAYCFIGSNVTITAGSAVGDRIVVGAGSVITKRLDGGPALYAGTPARYVKALPGDAGYFARTRGKVL